MGKKRNKKIQLEEEKIEVITDIFEEDIQCTISICGEDEIIVTVPKKEKTQLKSLSKDGISKKPISNYKTQEKTYNVKESSINFAKSVFNKITNLRIVK